MSSVLLRSEAARLDCSADPLLDCVGMHVPRIHGMEFNEIADTPLERDTGTKVAMQERVIL